MFEYQFKIEATLRCYCNFNEEELSRMTYFEAERFYDFFIISQSENHMRMTKNMAIYIAQGCFVGNHGTKKHLESYVRNIQNVENIELIEQDANQQFDQEFRKS